MRQHYELGQWFRKRYGTFLNSSYVRTEISVRSTAYDRTIMSALSNLAGLYPPSNKQIWNKELLWQPIPVFSVPKEDDFVSMKSYFCKLRLKLKLIIIDFLKILFTDSGSKVTLNVRPEACGFRPGAVVFFN